MEADDPAELAASPEVALFGAALLTVGLALLPAAVLLARHLFPERADFRPRWGFVHVLLVLLAGISLLLFASAALGRAFDLERGGAPPLFRLAAQGAVDLGLVAVIALLAQRLDPAGWRCLGLWRGLHLRAVLTGFASLFATAPLLFGAMAVWPWVLARFGVPFEPQEVAVDIASLSGGELAAAAVLAVAVIPLGEEVLFRAFLQPLLVHRLGAPAGLVATSLVFAALHGPSPFLGIFVLSMLLGAVMLRTQRLSAAWALHGAFNGFSVLLLLASEEAREILGPQAPGSLFLQLLLP